MEHRSQQLCPTGYKSTPVIEKQEVNNWEVNQCKWNQIESEWSQVEVNYGVSQHGQVK